MEINELVKHDPNFTESGFLAKVDNAYIMLLSSIMTENMERVKHKISTELFIKYQAIVDQLSDKNQCQMYEELNVKSSQIKNIEEIDDKFIITVSLISRYMDYKVDKTTGNYISGINDHRIEKENILTFEKKKETKQETIVRKCPSCGANMDINNTGKCTYCGSIYNTQDYDWLLVDLK